MPKTKFLFVCHDRSGGNLFRNMISAPQTDIYCIPALRLFEILHPVSAMYGSLSDDNSYLRLVEDIFDLVRHNHHPLPVSVTLEDLKESLFSTLKPRSIVNAVERTFELIGERMPAPA